MQMLLDAFNYANAKHKGQRRKGGAEYIVHPIQVSYIVAAYKRSRHMEELLVASLLHDVMEDCARTEDERTAIFIEMAQKFTPLVASLVKELTNDDAAIEQFGKRDYQCRKLMGMSSYGLIIKLADRMHNINDKPTEKMVNDTLFIMSFLRDNRKLSKTHLSMVEEIEKICAVKLASFAPAG